jgi:hypothetical protein
MFSSTIIPSKKQEFIASFKKNEQKENNFESQSTAHYYNNIELTYYVKQSNLWV